MNVVFEVVPIPVQGTDWFTVARKIWYYPAVWIQVGGYGTYMVPDQIQGRPAELFAPDSKQDELPYTDAKNFKNECHLRETIGECFLLGSDLAHAFINKLKARGGDFPEHYQFGYENTKDDESI
jgi:hypothetical protein